MEHHALPAGIGKPPPADDIDATVLEWAFARVRHLFDACDLVCDGHKHRIREVELYLHSPSHPDPFVHQGEHQMRPGAWYFHRSGKSYRGGSFKGLDFTTGGPGVACGWLLRTLETADGRLISGSCNVVDHLLEVAGEATIAPLDDASRDALDARSRLHLAPSDTPRAPAPILTTPRVGLTLRRADRWPLMPAYIGRRLRFLDDPRRIKKGRVQAIAALLADGLPIPDIRSATGSPIIAIRRAAAAFEAGRGQDPARWNGVRLSNAACYGLYGATMAGR